MRKLTLKLEFEFLEQVQKMSNGVLLEETISLSAGDDYDGFFSTRGSREYEIMLSELNYRLKKISFLEEDLFT